MDLKILSGWTRERLEEEARKLGLEEVESLPRSELVLRLLASGGLEGLRRASRIPTVRRAGEILDVAYQAAYATAPRQMEALRNLTRTLPEMARRLSTRPPQAPDSRSKQGLPPSESSFARGRQAHDGLVTSTDAAHAPRPAEPATAAEPSTRRFVEEPARTRGMARVLAEQGHRGLALSIYQELMSVSPGDAALRQEAEKAGRGEPVVERHTAVGMVSPEVFQLGLPDDNDRVGYELGGDGVLSLSWRVSPDGVRRAGAALGQPGELAVRVICVVPDAEQVVRSEIWEHGPVGEAGDWTAESIPGLGRCFAAVGLRAEDRFVSIAHAEVRPG